MSDAQSLLECSPEEGARRLALSYVDEGRAAADRVVAGGDEEALHDLRVALRKLRTVLRTHREDLRGSSRREHRKRLQELVTSTGSARDCEVQLAWLTEVALELAPIERPGAEWLRERLLDKKDVAYVRLRSATVPALLDLLPKLRRRLERWVVERKVDEPASERRFAEVTSARLREQADELRSALRLVQSVEDDTIIHEARIHGKRVRYLLEPLKDEIEEAKEITKRLKALQDLLGELNDVAVRTRALREHIEQAALDRARKLAAEAETGFATPGGAEEEAGLLALVRISHDRRQELYGALEREWIPLGSQLDDLVKAVHALAESIVARKDAPSEEIERKYLLDALPEHVRGRPALEIDQGYIPGDELHERLRRMRKDGETRFYRTVKLGRGVRRIEIEEETTREVFEVLWALTKGRRVKKRRYVVDDGSARWEIDEFVDRELFLAEIELPTVETEVMLPSWLARHVVREVTDDPTYVNLRLAR